MRTTLRARTKTMSFPIRMAAISVCTIGAGAAHAQGIGLPDGMWVILVVYAFIGLLVACGLAPVFYLVLKRLLYPGQPIGTVRKRTLMVVSFGLACLTLVVIFLFQLPM